MGIKLKLSDIGFHPIVGVSTKDPAPGRPRTMVRRFMVSIPSSDGESRVLLCNRGGEGGAPIPVLVTTDKGRARERVAEAFGVLGGRPKWFRSAYGVNEDGAVFAPDEKGVLKKTKRHIEEATSRWTRDDGVVLWTVASPAQELEFDSRSVEASGIAFEEDYKKESYASWLSRWGAPAPKPVEAAPEDMAAMIAQAVAAAVAAAMPAPAPVKEPAADAATIAAMMAKIEELSAALAAAQGGSEGE